MTEPQVPTGWARDVTRPTPGEVEALTSPLDPRLAHIAREVTRPTVREVAALRPRQRSPSWLSGPRLGALAPLTVLVAAAVVALTLASPTELTGRVVEDPPGVFMVVPGQDLFLGEVRIRGSGTVRLDSGVLEVTGALELEVRDPLTLRVGGQEYAIEDAHVVVQGSQVQIEPYLTAAAPEPIPVVEVSPGAAPAVDAEPVAPPPQVELDRDWLAVVELVERRGPVAARLEALRTYIATHPGTRWVPEAEAQLLLLDPSGDPGERLAAVERWLDAHPSGPRILDLEALAARIARDGLRDCAKARPHDVAVAERGSPSQRSRAAAFLALCSVGTNPADALSWLERVDDAALDPALKARVDQARALLDPGGDPNGGPDGR
ncbi:MAG: hypothetical protein ABMA64_11620 [Myxococcota bacterium]